MELYDNDFCCMELYDKQFRCMEVNPGLQLYPKVFLIQIKQLELSCKYYL